MRLPLIDPAKLTPEQRPVYDDMRAGIEKNFPGFKSHRRKRHAAGAMESVAPRAEIRQADLGPYVGAFGVAFAAAHGARGSDSGHWNGIPLRLMNFMPT